MEICGEHGEEIAFAKARSYDTCPACDQIAEITADHAAETEKLENQISSLEEQLSAS